MRNDIKMLNGMEIETFACCCGHGRYFPTVVVKYNGQPTEFYTGTKIPRKKRFYFKDKSGYFYIPEVENEIA